MKYLENLNDKQREAAMHTEGPLLILAGAGSGKTSTMTRRIAYMIMEKGVSPYEILAVTFTNKAAREMRERVEALVGEGLNMWITTFHSACLRILRMHADELGYSRDFTIYDPVDQRSVIKSCIKAENVDDKTFAPNYVLSIISDAKEKGKDSAQYASEAGGYKEQVIARLYKGYEATLKKNNAMDFDDLIWRTVLLLEQFPAVLEKYRNKFRYIMVDEYQDTNYMQYRLVKLLAQQHQNICVVGDDDQCIYQWRGADIKNILSFEKDFPGTKVVKLEQNYRSAGNILKAAHSVIKRNKGRKEKKLWTEFDDGHKIMYKRLDNEKSEASYVAQEIDRLKTKNRLYSDFAVLYRTNAQSRNFEEAFMAAGIPYRVLGGAKFYDRKEIKDMMAYMRLVLNPSDDLAFARIINEPKRSIGDKTLAKLQMLAEQYDASLFELLTDDEIVDGLSAKAAKGIRSLISLLAECHSQHDEMKVSDVYDRLLVESGYLAALEAANTVEAEGRIENLLEFKSVMYDSEEENPQITLAEFMEQVALVADVDNHHEDENAVVLMTLHSAKGLEFPVVFMPGMEDGLFPGYRAMDSLAGIEEERRLCYVGITRAKERLFLSSAVTRTLYGRTDFTRASQFLKEIDLDLFDAESDGATKNSFQEGGGNIEVQPRPKYGLKNKPFDQLKYIKQNTADLRTAESSSKASLTEGTKVKHPKFGEGLIISINKNTATIAFDSVGIKKLALDIAPLTKI
ncbi:MAG: DNA helicase PcrA [Firmicutes bacterium]|nr:DNA helicase PcrA [Bacillota bacterium]